MVAASLEIWVKRLPFVPVLLPLKLNLATPPHIILSCVFDVFVCLASQLPKWQEQRCLWITVYYGKLFSSHIKPKGRAPELGPTDKKWTSSIQAQFLYSNHFSLERWEWWRSGQNINPFSLLAQWTGQEFLFWYTQNSAHRNDSKQCHVWEQWLPVYTRQQVPKAQMKIMKMVVTSIALWGQVTVAVCSWSERFALRAAIILWYLPTIKLLCLVFSSSNL